MAGAPNYIPHELMSKLTRDEGDFFDDYSDGKCFLIRNRLLEEKTGLLLDSMSCEVEKNSLKVFGSAPLKAITENTQIIITGYNDKGRVVFHQTGFFEGASFEIIYFREGITEKLGIPLFIKVLPAIEEEDEEEEIEDDQRDEEE